MDRANVVKEELTDKDTRFLAVYVEAQNSCLILLSENEDKLGTMAIAVPKANEMLGLASSSILVGDRHIIIRPNVRRVRCFKKRQNRHGLSLP